MTTIDIFISNLHLKYQNVISNKINLSRLSFIIDLCVSYADPSSALYNADETCTINRWLVLHNAGISACKPMHHKTQLYVSLHTQLVFMLVSQITVILFWLLIKSESKLICILLRLTATTWTVRQHCRSLHTERIIKQHESFKCLLTLLTVSEWSCTAHIELYSIFIRAMKTIHKIVQFILETESFASQIHLLSWFYVIFDSKIELG